MSVSVRVSIRPEGTSLTACQARTALYGWLYARHEKGALVLRVEAGGSPVAADDGIEALCEELRWLGVDWDEGPLFEAGAHPDSIRARVVGDRRLGITHVLVDFQERSCAGQEKALCRSLGWDPPQYVFLPALVFSDGAVQDRGALAVYRARGYLPLALANHLARLGWTPRGKRELLPMPELAARFDLRRVSRTPASFDLQQLNWFNRRALCALDVDQITALLVPRWREAYGGAETNGAGTHRATGTALPPAQWQQALALALREELDCLDQGIERARFAFVDEVTPDETAREILSQPYAAEVLAAFVRELPAVEPFLYDEIDGWIAALRQRFKAALGAAHGVRSRDVMYVLRAALTGRMDGPCLVEICQLLGRERCIKRARQQFSHSVLPFPAKCDIIGH
jgi:glutamyl/glutaminyl-tRNA synthetase